jgi:hypothetical protein
MARLLHNTRESSSLEPHSSIPLCTYRYVHAAGILGMTSIWVRQLLDEVLGRFFIPPLRNDDVCFFVIGSRRRVNASNFFNEIRSWWKFLGTCTSPRAL